MRNGSLRFTTAVTLRAHMTCKERATKEPLRLVATIYESFARHCFFCSCYRVTQYTETTKFSFILTPRPTFIYSINKADRDSLWAQRSLAATDCPSVGTQRLSSLLTTSARANLTTPCLLRQMRSIGWYICLTWLDAKPARWSSL
jgi:hypothetical protein